jgi:hypothetical protein
MGWKSGPGLNTKTAPPRLGVAFTALESRLVSVNDDYQSVEFEPPPDLLQSGHCYTRCYDYFESKDDK